MLRNFSELENRIRKEARPQRIALCGCDDLSSLKALKLAEERGRITKVFLIGNTAACLSLLQEHGISFADCVFIAEPDIEQIAVRAIGLLRSGNADVLVKGSLASGPFFRAVSDPENGILCPGKALNSVMMIEKADGTGFVYASGCPLNKELPLPRKLGLLMDTVELARTVGKRRIRAAVLTSSEEVNPGIQSTVDAFGLSSMRFPDCEIRGPLTLGSALKNDEMGRIVAGYDILFGSEPGMHQLITRAFRLSEGREFAGILSHTEYPVAVSSRVDCVETRYNSILLALLPRRT